VALSVALVYPEEAYYRKEIFRRCYVALELLCLLGIASEVRSGLE